MIPLISTDRLHALETLVAGHSDPGATIKYVAADAETDVEKQWSLPMLNCGATGDLSTDFILGEKIGEGGMGVVRVAHQRALDRDVAVKHLRRNDNSPEASACLMKEARITGRLEHPTVVPIYAVGTSEAMGPAVVMRRIQGQSWLDVLGRPDRDLNDELDVWMRVAEGMEYAHSRGVVHRDLKPDNIMLGEYGEVYIVDWGIAVEARDQDATPNQLVGTPAYIAPEMIDGDVAGITPRTDIFLLGGILFEILYRRPPHDEITAFACFVSAAKQLEFPDNDDVPGALVAICQRACAYDPNDRYAGVDEFLSEVSSYLRYADAAKMLDEIEDELTDIEHQLPSAATPIDQSDGVHQALEEIAAKIKQAQTLHPDSTVSAELRHRSNRILLRSALRGESLEEAERLAEQLGDLPAGEADALEALRAKRRSEQAAVREQDPSVARSHRRLVMVIAAIAVLPVLMVSIWESNQDVEPSQWSLALRATVQIAVVLPVVWIGRARFYANAYNGKITDAYVSFLIAQPVIRFGAIYFHVPINVQTCVELLTLAAVSAPFIRERRGFVGHIALCAIAIGLTMAFPRYARIWLHSAALAVVVLTWWLWKRTAPDSYRVPRV